MDAVDIRKHLSHEAFVCLHVLETCFQISTLDIENPVICYHCYETLPKHRSYGVVRKFSSLEEATKHYESLLKESPDPIYVLKPDGPLYRKNEEDDVYMVRYSRVFEVLEPWRRNFQSKNRSDDDIHRICRKVGPALASRYERTGSLGTIFNDTVMTDDEQVFFWNWAPGSKEYKSEIRQLRYYVKQMKKLATNPVRFEEFEDFLTTKVIPHPPPLNKDLTLWLFHHPVFMTEEGGVRFLEVLHKITCDPRTRVKRNNIFTNALQVFDNKWKAAVTGSSDDALKDILAFQTYSNDGYDLPRFAHNCVKHYSQTVVRLGLGRQNERTQVEIVNMLNTTYFEKLMEISFQALYKTMESLDVPGAAPLYSSKQILDMLRGKKSIC